MEAFRSRFGVRMLVLYSELQVWHDLNFQSLPIHPAFRLDLREPVLSGRNSAQIFLNVLLPDVPHWDLLPFAVGDRDTEDLLAEENPFGVVTKGAVTEASKERFRLIKPVVNWQVVFRRPAESLRAALCMLEWVCHVQNSLVS